MQNKPNSQNDKINPTLFVAKAYENKPPRPTRKNKPKTNPIQTQTNPISEKPKMNLSFYSTKDYDNKPPLWAPAKQTQNKPKQTQFPLPQTPHSSQLPIPRDTQSCPERSRRDEIRHTKSCPERSRRDDIRYTTYDIRNTKYKPNTNPISVPLAPFILYNSRTVQDQTIHKIGVCRP